MLKQLLIIALLFFTGSLNSETIELESKNTFTVVEMNTGDTVEYATRDGREMRIELLNTETRILFTTLDTLKRGAYGHGTIYSMTCKLNIDGQPMQMVRYVPVQQSFYEPYVVNGVAIWFDALRSLNNYFNENHGKCLPTKEARFAIHDADVPICPEEMSNWVNLPAEKVLAKDAYRGDDVWLGTYYGADLHGGMDINMPNNTTLYAPISFDQHFYFNSLKAGHNNNRWRGIRSWENGDRWALQTHHLVELLVPEYKPVKKGQPYAFTAGVHSGYHPHTHFVFKVKQPGFDEFYMDPWILFWQIIANNREQENAKAAISPLKPTRPGQPVQFFSKGSHKGMWGGDLRFHWDFGDGVTSFEENPVHVFSEPGVYPVTLLVDDDHEQDMTRQFLTVNGDQQKLKSFKISCPGEPSFRKVPSWKTIEYDRSMQPRNTLVFKGYHRQEHGFQARELFIKPHHFDWQKKPDRPYRIETIYRHGSDWLDVQTEFVDKQVKLTVDPQVDKLMPLYGFYEAFVLINNDRAVNSPQRINVRVEFDSSRPDSVVIIDNADAQCTMSNYFWLKPEFHYEWSKGHNSDYLINGRQSAGEFVRFTPNLMDGEYRVQLYGKAYKHDKLLQKSGGFYALVHSKHGMEKIWIEPAKSLDIGVFEFLKGREGYVEIISDDSEGLILVDTVKFEKLN